MNGGNILNRPYKHKSIEEIENWMSECREQGDEINDQIWDLQDKSAKLSKRISQLMPELCCRLEKATE